MALTTAGKSFIAQAIANYGSPTFFSTTTWIGVGDSSTDFAVDQTDLQAATNKFRKQVGSASTVSGAVISCSASFGTSEANFAWAEWGVFNASSGGTMLTRKVESLGTKASGSTWVLSVSLTIA